jgi:hypothetical protein
MVKNSAEGNKARTARYRAGLAARGIRPVQLYAPEAAHALLRQVAGLMSREQDPLEPRQAMRQASGANDPGQEHGDQGRDEQALAAAVAAVEAAKVELAEARDAERQAKQQALAQAEVARVAAEGTVAAIGRAEAAERAQALLADELQAAEAAAAETRAEAARFQKMTGVRSKVVRWLAHQAIRIKQNVTAR